MENLFSSFDYSRPHHFILRASFTRNGITYYARDYGHRAFRIPVYN